MNSDNPERQPLLKGKDQCSHSIRSIDSSDSSQDELRGRELLLALSFPLLGILVVALDVTLTSTISATVASDFNSLSIVSWLGSSYLVAMTVVQSVSGSLTDRYGRRTGFLVGLFLFAIGNLVCGLASNAPMLIAARAVAGAGGGAINSITTFVISDLVSLRRRPMWQGLGNVGWALGMGLGGVFGGVMNDLAGWRWAFIALTPLTILIAIGAYFTFVRGLPRPLNDDNKEEAKEIDYLGSIMLTGMLVCLVLGLNLTENGIPGEGRTRILIIGLLITSKLFLSAFVVVEKWFASNPVIPLHLLNDRSVFSSCVSGFFLASSMHTLLYYAPLLIQAQGFSTSEVGLQMLGEPVGAAVGPFLVGLAIRELGSYTLLKPVSWVIYITAPLVFFFSSLDTPVWAVFLGLTAMGAGFGSALTVNLTGLLANVEQCYSAKSTAMSYVFRQSGASVGLALAGLIFRARLTGELSHTRSFQPLESSDSLTNQCGRHSFDGTSHPDVCVAYANALHGVFLFTLVAGSVGLVFGMMIRSRRLDHEDVESRVAHHRHNSIA